MTVTGVAVAVAVAVGIPLAVGLGSAAATMGEARGPWYASLSKPDWTPPSWVFGPVWTVLYVMMGIASYLVWRAGGSMSLYAVQLALNCAWSILFFKAHDLGLATVDVVALWVVLAATTLQFSRVDPVAGYLMLPYLAWTTYAAALTISISARN